MMNEMKLAVPVGTVSATLTDVFFLELHILRLVERHLGGRLFDSVKVPPLFQQPP
jgi:hypothetical protein